MVIGVLSVLLAIILPTIKTVHAAALKKQAQAGATVLAQAAIRYKTEYGFWPGQVVENTADTVKLGSEFVDQAVPVIISRYLNETFAVNPTTGPNPIYLRENNANGVYRAFRRVGEKQGATFKPNPLNPKGIHFLDLTDETDPARVNYPDPWGRGYILFMGLNPRSTFTHTVTFPNGGTQNVRVDNAIAFAFSYGPDGDRSTNYLYSAGVRR
jgi:type II secretory pathway pseudopilin PulG